MAQKTNQQIEYIIKSCRYADQILQQCIENFSSFITEKDVYHFLINEAKKRRLRLAFKPIVAVGKNAAEPHHKANNTKLKKGFVVLDFGVRYKGYCSDITRTIYLGKPSSNEKKMYNLVLNAQRKAIKAVKPGIVCKNLHLIAANALGIYKKYFIHSLGHGVGKRIHEAPKVGPRNQRKLKKNTVITIEPGIYIKNKLGIRIEDTMLVTNSARLLTRTTKSLIIIT